MSVEFYPGKPVEIDSKSNLFIDRSKDPEWVAEPKWNGWRAFITSDKDGKITVYSSKGEVLSYFKSDGLVIPPGTFLDTEWVDRRTTNVKNKIIVFDILKYATKILAGEDILRRSILEDLFSNNLITSTGVIDIDIVDRFYDSFDNHFLEVKNDSTIEGLVLKKTTAPLEISYKGQFKSFNQIKVKK